jgi:hypothetical protein
MNPNITHQLEFRYKVIKPNENSFEFQLHKIHKLLGIVETIDPLLNYVKWFVATGIRDSSYTNAVFDKNGPIASALNVLNERAKRNDAVKSFTLWNGEEQQARGASISSYFDRQDGVASSVKMSVTSSKDNFRLGNWKQIAEMLASAVKIFNPLYGLLETTYYDSVFKDRPGVGWMLYLPHILTDQQIPEARALVPVMGTDDEGKEKQIGTIIVSVTDAPFSDENPEHVKIANAIEIRLVDQDLLPRFIDL